MKRTIVLCLSFFYAYSFCTAQTLRNDKSAKHLVLTNKKIRLVLDYDHKANISSLEVNGQRVIDGNAGVYSAIRTKVGHYTTLELSSDPVVNVTGKTATISGIKYGNASFTIGETWRFDVADSAIQFHIDRTVSAPVKAEKVAFPVFTFRDTAVWEGAYQDYGGLAWFYLFNKRLDTYGVHSRSSRFWNSRTGNGLTVAVETPGNEVAMDYSRTAEDRIAYTIGVSPT